MVELAVLLILLDELLQRQKCLTKTVLVGDVEFINEETFFSKYPLLFPNISIIIAVFTILISIINKFRGIKDND